MANHQHPEGHYPTPDHLDSNHIEGAVIGDAGEMAEDQRKAVIAEGNSFAKSLGVDPSLLISGHFSDVGILAEEQLRISLLRGFGYPKHEEKRVINVLLDSGGGSLDSAFKIVLYLWRYASELNVYVARQAKSASTLIALGADHLYMSDFGELGPLDTQIPDPRNRTGSISALDCYQSVDYVRQFGILTMRATLKQLVEQAGDLIPLSQLLDTSAKFATGSIAPMLQAVSPLDFGDGDAA